MSQTFSAVLPLRRKTWLDTGELVTEIRLLVEQTGATVRLDPRLLHGADRPRGLLSLLGASGDPDPIMLEVDGVRLKITQHGEPCADSRAINRYINPALWAEGLGELTDHRAYIRVYESGIDGEEGPDAIFDRAAAVTACASVIARLTDPVSVIWLPANNAVPMRLFGRAMEQLLDGVAPLELWVRWHAIPPGEKDDLHPGISTGGFDAFAGREIRAEPSEVPTKEMIDHVFALAHRLVDDKIAVSDNQLVPIGEAAGLRVRVRAPARGRTVPTYEVAFEPLAPAKSRPRPERKRAGGGTAAQEAPAPDPMRHAAEPARIDGIRLTDGGNGAAPRPIRVIPGGKTKR